MNESVAKKSDDSPKGSAEDKGAQDDLDEVLNAYENQDESTQPKPAEKPKEDDTLAEVRKLREEIQAEKFQKDISSVISRVRGELPADTFDDDFVEAFLDSRARKDERLRNAWNRRHENPKQFEKVVSGLEKEFQSKFSKLPDPNATDDRDSVAAAVRRASTSAPDSDDIDVEAVKRMTDQEFEQWKAEQGRKAKR